ncbi:MAG: LysM peptidoglycan-binding domain-containing protein [Proteobacteria bacterium]|nr:MAG: LysM peptidoglycan-binding domain-containing protein [Pseudomonadota bacterium]
MNKGAVEGIKPGMILHIPVAVKQAPKQEVAAPESQEQQPATTDIPVANTEPDYSNQPWEHKVSSGETLSVLAQRYGTTVSAIKQANPKVAKRGLRVDDILQIPPATPSDEYVKEVETALPGRVEHAQVDPLPETKSQTEESRSGTIAHKVKSGETLSVLAQKFHTTIAAINEANPKVAKRGLRADETIQIPSADAVHHDPVQPEAQAVRETSVTETSATPEKIAQPDSVQESAVQAPVAIEHKVQNGETLFGLARKYNVGVDAIKKQNPRVMARGLQVGQIIKITPE